MQNPYTSRNMIKDSASFFGRVAEIEEIFTNLLNGFQSTSLIGERRSGKSSLLWHISRLEVYGEHLAGAEKPFLFVYFDLQQVASLTQDSFFNLLSECISEQIRPEESPGMEGVETTQDRFRKLVKKIKDDYAIVLCLDEFEIVRSNSKFDKGFLNSLRSYADAHDVAYVTSSRRRLEEICKNTDHLQGSEFWNIFVQPPLSVGLLERDEAIELIMTPAAREGLPLEQPEVEYALKIAGQHPLFLQIACFHIFEAKKRLAAQGRGVLGPIDYSNILDNFLMAATPHFDSILNRLSLPERNLLVDPTAVDLEGDMKGIVRNLVNRGLLILSPNPSPFSTIFGNYVKENHSPDRSAVTSASGAGQGLKQLPPHAIYPDESDTGSGPLQQRSENEELTRLDVWVSRNHEVLVSLVGTHNYAQFCPNHAKADSARPHRFDSTLNNLLRLSDWRAEKYQIGKEVSQYFEPNPEVAQAYTIGRAAVSADEDFLITFKCPEDMLDYPFEFINSLSTVEEGGQRHLVLTHPLRKSIIGLRTKNRPLERDFYKNEKIRVLLVSSNVSGTVVVDDEVYTLPEIPGVRTEVERIAAMITEGQKTGTIRCSVDVKHDVTCDDMAELVQYGGYDVIHYSGHAIHTDSPESSSIFFWQDDKSHNDSIGMLTTNQLNFIVERTKLKFFYLSCCQGASAGASDKLRNNDFLGITHALLVGGVPAVLAMRWPLNDRTATFLASSFYSELFKGAGIELSLFRARRRLQSRWPNDHSWLSPVLIVQI